MSTASPRVHVALRLAAVPIVAVVLVAGVWITGGVITNDFGVAMWLTVVWMGLAGLVCLAIALRRRELALPLLGSYVVVAAALGLYLGQSMFLDDEVNEDVAVAAPAPSRVGDGSTPARSRRAGPRNVSLGSGSFESLAHPASGKATAIRLANGGEVLTLTDFEVDNGPDLRVYLVAGPARNEGEVDDFKDLGALKGNKGDQQYELPRGTDTRRYSTVVIWCRAFSVAFARAPLAAGR